MPEQLTETKATTEGWQRKGTTVFQLQPRGHFGRKAMEMENRWAAFVNPGRGCSDDECEAVAAKMAAADKLLLRLKLRMEACCGHFESPCSRCETDREIVALAEGRGG